MDLGWSVGSSLQLPHSRSLLATAGAGSPSALARLGQRGLGLGVMRSCCLADAARHTSQRGAVLVRAKVRHEPSQQHLGWTATPSREDQPQSERAAGVQSTRRSMELIDGVQARDEDGQRGRLGEEDQREEPRHVPPSDAASEHRAVMVKVHHATLRSHSVGAVRSTVGVSGVVGWAGLSRAVSPDKPRSGAQAGRPSRDSGARRRASPSTATG